MEKKCSKCNVVKNVSEFGKRKDAKDGLKYNCKTYSNESRKFSRLLEIEKKLLETQKIKKSRKGSNSESIEKIKEQIKQYQSDNGEDIRNYKKKYKEVNKENEKRKALSSIFYPSLTIETRFNC